MTPDGVQVVGIFLAAAVGSLGLYITANELHFCHYGRLTLFWFSIWQFWFAAMRAFVLFDVMNRETSITLNILSNAVFVAALINLIVVHAMWHRSGLSQGEAT